jgi:hypothetical protein
VQNAPVTTAPGALVPLEQGTSRTAAFPRPLAGFIAQLLACRNGVPAYRARRRAEPETAAASYGAPRAVPPGRFERWL